MWKCYRDVTNTVALGRLGLPAQATFLAPCGHQRGRRLFSEVERPCLELPHTLQGEFPSACQLLNVVLEHGKLPLESVTHVVISFRAQALEDTYFPSLSFRSKRRRFMRPTQKLRPWNSFKFHRTCFMFPKCPSPLFSPPRARLAKVAYKKRYIDIS